MPANVYSVYSGNQCYIAADMISMKLELLSKLEYTLCKWKKIMSVSQRSNIMMKFGYILLNKHLFSKCSLGWHLKHTWCFN